MSEAQHRTARGFRTLLAAVLLICTMSPGVFADGARKVLVLGIDGLDPELLQRFVEQGALPNFSRLMEQGDFRPLQTSMPPSSPIAWSTFITGMGPGGHGIFDFIHREPDTITPYMSMARTHDPSRTLTLGSWVIPLTSGRVENLRQGRAFWEILEERGVPTTIFRIPANFPPVESGGKAFSGMGTPDILGTPGQFSFYTNRTVPNADDITGGKVYPVRVTDNRVEAQLVGPTNTFRRQAKTSRNWRGDKQVEYVHPKLTVDFTVHLDPERPVALLEVQDQEFILKEGEWSPWVRVELKAVPLLASISAIGRFYLKQVRPDFELYVSPLQINPEDPAMPISTPKDWSHELFEELGYFYTQELPEDTKALSGGVLSGREFWDQSQFVYRERRRALDYFLERFEEGFLFFYFSSVDQGSHMLWRYFDPDHPGFVVDEQLEHGIRILYQELDEALGRVLEAVDEDTTLIVMSDHGFCPFYWQVNLNTWLLENGYVRLKNPSRQGALPLFLNVDWSRTQAYALGLNSVYVNLRGREKQGTVNPGQDYHALLDRLEQDLLEMRDPRNGNQAVTLVVQTQRDLRGPHLARGPDIIVGYNWGYRSSWKSPLGEFPRGVFADNDEAWSGDHHVDYRHVPGVLLTNRKITLAEPHLYDLTVAILDEYGIPKLQEMLGEDCLGEKGAEVARAGD